MSQDALKAILEELPDPSFVEGTATITDRLAIQLPDGDVGALDDQTFVGWLVEHAEDAPFGDRGETVLDPGVRQAKRLRARGAADVSGFDVAALLPAIEAALSPRVHLEARLEDVIVYEEGGKFARHKDTPRTARLVGTLVVGLPVAHTGGGFTIVDGGSPHMVDWSGAPPDPRALRWVALFSDVDHEIAPVTSGARVTLVYSLVRSDRPRADATRDPRLAKLRAAAAGVVVTAEAPLMIACTRQIVTDGSQPQSLDALRGTDREIAEVFAEAGFAVSVRACVVGDSDGDPAFPATTHMWAITRLKQAIPPTVIEGMDAIVSFTDSVDMDEEFEDEMDATYLADYVLDAVQLDRWVVRQRAAATVIYEGMYSDTGYFGNEATMGHLYTLAAIEVAPG